MKGFFVGLCRVLMGFLLRVLTGVYGFHRVFVGFIGFLQRALRTTVKNFRRFDSMGLGFWGEARPTQA